MLQELEKEPAHLRDTLRNLILTHDRRFLYLRNQKCACTQTTQILYAYGHNGQTYPGNVHRANDGLIPARYRWMDIKPVYEAHTSFVFTFVRDPEARILSAFRNFFLDETNNGRHKHMVPMQAHFWLRRYRNRRSWVRIRLRSVSRRWAGSFSSSCSTL